MALKGFKGNPEGLSFETYLQKNYIPALKKPKDLDGYDKWVAKGVFEYRN
jgi:hypothetical protein